MGVVKTLIDNKYIDVNSRNDVSNHIRMCNIRMTKILSFMVLIQLAS